MLREIRLKKIIKIMKEKQNAAIDDLAEQLEVSKDTIRRDLMKLEEKNIVRRTHGGAILLEREATIFDYEQRSTKLNGVKLQLGKTAAAIIKDNSSVIFDSSTTVESVINQIGMKPLTAITNSLTHAMLLAKRSATTITLLP